MIFLTVLILQLVAYVSAKTRQKEVKKQVNENILLIV